MTRKWGPTGVGRLEGIGLLTQTKNDIKGSFVDCGHLTPCPEIFFEALDLAADFYRAHSQVRDESSPASVRTNLKQARDAALRLKKRLQALDGNSLYLLREVTNDGKYFNLLEELIGLNQRITAFDQAYKLAGQYPQKGDQPRYHRLWAADMIAEALREHVTIKVDNKPSGIFIPVLESFFSEVAKGEQINISKLARDALTLDIKTKGQGSTPTEYYPPK